MTSIGEYRDWAVILPVVRAAADGTGEEVETWPDPPADPTEHAARLESPTGGEKTAPLRYSYPGGLLRFRCHVTVNAADQIRLVESGVTYSVVGVWLERSRDSRGWQTVCSLSVRKKRAA